MFEDKPRKRDWIPRPPRGLSDIIGKQLLSMLSWIEEAESDDVLSFDEKEPLIERVFLEQFHYHSKWPALAIFLISVSFLIDSFLGPVEFQIYGLIFDMTGALFLALGIIRGKCGLARDTRESDARYGDGEKIGGIHVASLRATVADTIDGLFGAVFLIIGFSIQIVALWG